MIVDVFLKEIGPMFHGAWTAFLKTWWLFAIIIAVRIGPRLVRGILLRRGSLQ